MGIEIERKFLVQNDGWRALATGKLYRQGYIAASPDCTVRVRIAGDQGYLTIKGATSGISRPEYEYGIPLEEAAQLLGYSLPAAFDRKNALSDRRSRGLILGGG